MISTILVGLALVFMIINLIYFFTNHEQKKSYFQASLFHKLFFAILGITFGFAILYYFLSMNDIVLRVSDEEGKSGAENFLDCLYFSGATILSVGYGDLVPVGSARFFALIEAAIGFLLPTAFFVKSMSENGKPEQEVQGNKSDKRKKAIKKTKELMKPISDFAA